MAKDKKPVYLILLNEDSALLQEEVSECIASGYLPQGGRLCR